ncbi:MAG: hypothetical protein KJZ93_23100 [Caldilineaceae bacterium]|nr:hypothetical protein [Caldilineaceae bacterium]
MPHCISLNSQNTYEIRIHGQPDDSWREWFGDAQIKVATPNDTMQATTFTDVVMDQAGLVGLIRRLHGLGILLLSVRLVE